MKWKTLLALGRVSNLPTVWTNVLAGAVLARTTFTGAGDEAALSGVVFNDAVFDLTSVAVVMSALSAFYVGGMFLNDAFDRDIDARERPERPIPSGRASATQVFAIGYGLLATGFVGVASIARAHGTLLHTCLAAVALALAILLYNWHHKGNPLSPLVMALCRVLVYVTAGLALGGALTSPLWIGSAVLCAYLIALTFVAKRGGSARVVGALLAAICLVDAAALALCQQPLLATFATLGVPLTLALHRWVAGT